MWRQVANGPPGYVTLPFLNWEVGRIVAIMACLTPVLLPVIWITGTTLFWVLIVALANCFCWRRPSAVEWALVATALLLVLGLLAGQMIGVPSDRATSSIYHLSHWFVLLAFANIGRFVMADERNHDLFALMSKGAALCLCLMVAYLLIVAWYVSKNPLVPVQFPSLIVGRFASEISVLSGYVMIAVNKVNTISSGFEWRLIGFGLWTSEGAYLASIVGLFAMIYAHSRFGIIGLIVVEIAVLIALHLAGSRTSSAAYTLSMGVWLVLLGRYWRFAVVLAIPLAIGAVALFIGYGMEFLRAEIAEAYEWRQASSGARLVSYLVGIEMVLDRNPLTGLGYLPMIPELVHIPIGSHSSWTSILVRGGFAALAVFALAQILLLGKMWTTLQRVKSGAPTARLATLLPDIILVRCLIVTLLSWLTEDLDGPAAGVAFAGMAIGLFLGLHNQDKVAGPAVAETHERMRWR
ncbi:MAG: O-antigen ligase family protein [Alphaproteobacteria bacterium]|nr:O-antigen ligase family protein [Alphaproteobacteria bacterium]